MSIYLSGQVEPWPSMEEMILLLQNVGLEFTVGRFSIRMKDMEHFVFQSYGGDLGPPSIDADASSLEQMLNDAGRISKALTDADVKHRFEIYDDGDKQVGYIHHRWPA
jgi:hypothetical protein